MNQYTFIWSPKAKEEYAARRKVVLRFCIYAKY